MNNSKPMFYVGLFAGGSDSLLNLNLRFLNLKIIKFLSEDMDVFINNLGMQPRSEKKLRDFFNEYIRKPQIMPESLFLAIPINRSKPVVHEHFEKLSVALLLMFPSNFKLVSVLTFNTNHDNRYLQSSTATWPYRGDIMRVPWDAYITIPNEDIKQANKFIRHFFKVYPELMYIQLAIDNYINSFNQRPLETCFTSLAIALESITNSQTEVSYQIARYCAVINSSSVEDGLKIFKATKRLYDVRSKIVHGDRIDINALRKCYRNLEGMTSRTLLELICHSIRDKNMLSDTITSSGFGVKKKLSSDYFAPNFNSQTQSIILEKVK